jgi:aminotransferase
MGAYYIMCNIAPLRKRFGLPNDVEFTRFLVTEIGVAAVPGSSFFRDASAGKNLIRFTFCKKEETLEAAAERLSKLSLQPAVAKQNQA